MLITPLIPLALARHNGLAISFNRPMHDALAGALSGTAACLLLQPLDVYKTRLQEHSGRPRRLAELWRGTLPTLVRNVPGTALYFVTLQQLRYLMIIADSRFKLGLIAPDGRSSPLANALAGGLSRLLAGFCFMPFTVLKVHFESQRFLGTRSLPAMIHGIYNLEGVRGLFKGFWATMLRDAPHSAIYLVCFEALRGSSSASSGSLAVNAISAFGSAVIASAATQPFDTVKTRIQLSVGRRGVGMWSAGRMILTQDGPLGFYRGTLPRLLRKVLSAAITWTIYEELGDKK
jgi:solute carrier family 25 protein 38